MTRLTSFSGLLDTGANVIGIGSPIHGGGCPIAAGPTVNPALTIAGAVLYSSAIVYDNRKEIAALPGKIWNWL